MQSIYDALMDDDVEIIECFDDESELEAALRVAHLMGYVERPRDTEDAVIEWLGGV